MDTSEKWGCCQTVAGHRYYAILSHVFIRCGDFHSMFSHTGFVDATSLFCVVHTSQTHVCTPTHMHVHVTHMCVRTNTHTAHAQLLKWASGEENSLILSLFRRLTEIQWIYNEATKEMAEKVSPNLVSI